MAIAILLGVLVLVGAGLVIAVRTAAAARRELDNLEGEFADARGSLALDSDSDPTPWSSVDLEILRDDVIVVEGADPFDTLTEMISPAAWREAQEAEGFEHATAAWDDAEDEDSAEHTMAWGDEDEGSAEHTVAWGEAHDTDSAEHAAAVWDDADEPDDLEHAAASWLASRESNGSEYTAASWLASAEANGSHDTAVTWLESRETNGSEHAPSMDLAPVEDAAPVAWEQREAPIIILVVGVGFLGAGMTAGVTTASRLRQTWGQFEDSFSQARVITLDPEARHGAPGAFDPDDARDGIVVDEDHDDDPAPARDPVPAHAHAHAHENGDSQVRWPPPRPTGLGPRPNRELEPIEWRAPADYAGRH